MERINCDGIQLNDGKVYNFTPSEPDRDHRGGITLEEKQKYVKCGHGFVHVFNTMGNTLC